jgi:signal transduction histidine kinase
MPTARARNTRTPLNAVLGFAQLLEREAAGLAPRQRLQVERIEISNTPRPHHNGTNTELLRT